MNKAARKIALALVITVSIVYGVYSSYNAYNIWSKYQWAIWRLQYPIPFDTHQILDRELSMAIREYVTLFPLSFLTSVITVTLGLILTAMNSGRKVILITTILMGSGIFLLFEAYNIWEIYQWASLQTTAPPLSYYGLVHVEASATYEALFPFYVLTGSILMTSGPILAAVNLRKYHRGRNVKTQTDGQQFFLSSKKR